MKNFLLLTLMILMPFAALARDKTDGQSETLAVQTMLCQKLAQHTPSNDVNFQPGVDAQGNAVAPADLNATQPIVKHFIEVPLTIDLARRMNLSVAGAEMRANIGVLRLGTQDGSVIFNGQDITQSAKILCDGGTPPATIVTSPVGLQQNNNVMPSPSMPSSAPMVDPNAPPLPATAAPSATSSP